MLRHRKGSRASERKDVHSTTNTNCTQSRNCTWVRALIGHITESPVPHPGAKLLKAHSPDDVSVNTASVWPPTVCMVNGCSRGADTVLLSTPPYTVSSSFKVKDTCREHRCCFILKNNNNSSFGTSTIRHSNIHK